MKVLIAVNHEPLEEFIRGIEAIDDVYIARNREKALEICKAEEPDLVVMTAALPGSLDIKELIISLTSKKFKDLRVVFIYGEDDDERKTFIDFLISRGVYDFFYGSSLNGDILEGLILQPKRRSDVLEEIINATHNVISSIQDNEPSEEKPIQENATKTKLKISKPEKDKDNVKIIEKTIEKEVIKFKPIITEVSSKLVIFAGVSPNAGTSFLAHSFSKFVADLNISTSMIELPMTSPNVYDSYNFKNLFKHGNSLQNMINIKESLPGNVGYEYEGVKWIALNPSDKNIKNWDAFKTMQLLYSVKGTSVNVLDVGTLLMNPCLNGILNRADYIFVVVDPLYVIKNGTLEIDSIKALRNEKKLPIEFIINKWPIEMETNNFDDLLNTPIFTYVPSVHLKGLYESAIRKSVAITDENIRKDLESCMFSITGSVLPKQLLSNYEQIAKSSKKKNKIKRRRNIIAEFFYVIFLALFNVFNFFWNHKWLTVIFVSILIAAIYFANN